MNKKAIVELINERGIVEGLSHSISLLGQRIILGVTSYSTTRGFTFRKGEQFNVKII